MSRDNSNNKTDHVRIATRIFSVKEISANYEGHTENIANRSPDVSVNGMFVNTSQRFPEGAVLNLQFRLAISGVEIHTRGEVRYCLPGVGVGVEFVGLSPQAVRQIEREVKLCRARIGRPTQKAALQKSRS
jgi:PilZ domain